MKIQTVTDDQKYEVEQLVARCGKVMSNVELSLKRVRQIQENHDTHIEKAKAEIHQAADVMRDKVLADISKKEKEMEIKVTQAAASQKEKILEHKKQLQIQQARFKTATEMANELSQSGSEYGHSLLVPLIKSNLMQLKEAKPNVLAESIGGVVFRPSSTKIYIPSFGSLSPDTVTSQTSALSAMKRSHTEAFPPGTSSSSSYVKEEFPSCTSEESGIGSWKLVQTFGSKKLFCCSRCSSDTKRRHYRSRFSNPKGKVHIFNQSGTFKQNLSTKEGLQPGQKSYPWNVVVSCQDGRVFITQGVSHVNVYDRDYNYKYQFTTKSTAKVQPGKEGADLRGLALDNHGCLLVGNCSKRGSNQYISKHSLDGAHVISYRVPVEPWYIAVTSNNHIIVVSHRNDTNGVQVLDDNAKVLRIINRPPEVSTWYPYGLCCTTEDEIYIANNRSDSDGGIYRFSVAGEYLGCATKDAKPPTGLVLTDDDNKMIVVEAKCVKLFSKQ